MRFASGLTAAALTMLALVPAAAAQEPSTVYRLDQGVTPPRIVREVKPVYTDAARKERIQGTVLMDVVVLSDGNVGDVTVTRSLDTTYGLDDAAVKAVKQWVFEPGKKDGKAVAVVVQIEMSFSLK